HFIFRLAGHRMSTAPDDFGHWLSAARDGSRDAMGRVFQACRRYLLHVARHEMNPDLQAKGGASDLVQETFLEAQGTFDRFEGNSEGELRAWLCRLRHHRGAKFRRRYRTTQKRRLARETALPPDERPARREAGGISRFENVAARQGGKSPSGELMAVEQ